jgi:hypothetical protein
MAFSQRITINLLCLLAYGTASTVAEFKFLRTGMAQGTFVPNADLWASPSFIDGVTEPEGEILQPNKWGGINPSSLAPGVGFKFTARGTATFDTTRLADFAKGQFLPSAIPVRGAPFFGAGSQANVIGSGSTAQVFAAGDTGVGPASAYTSFAIQNGGTEGGFSGVIQQAGVQLNAFTVGLLETALADPTSEPSTLDIAGPNARVTVQQPSSMTGQGRLSSFLYFSGDTNEGLIGDISVEQPTPEVLSITTKSPNPANGALTGMNFSPFARLPDLIATFKYSEGERVNSRYDEYWHVQFGSVFRSIGDENDTNTIKDVVFGWGLQLSGVYTMPLNPNSELRDAFGFSVTGGEGIGHYINDLHVASMDLKNGGNDAVFSNNDLVPLPAIAFYVGFTHNWTNYWQSSATYSGVQLESVVPQTGGLFPASLPSPYRRGEYVAVNLLYHDRPSISIGTKSAQVLVATGVEYLWGEHQTLAGDKGNDQRLLFQLLLAK